MLAFVICQKSCFKLFFCFCYDIILFLTCDITFTECGGKNYHLVHPTADIQSVINGTIKSSFEYGGQKCSACSRMYAPRSKWAEIKQGLVDTAKQIKLGPATETDSYLSAVIDDKVCNHVGQKKLNMFLRHRLHHFQSPTSNNFIAFQHIRVGY